MARSNNHVANKAIDSDAQSELWFMAREKLSESQLLLLLQIYLRLGKKFPSTGQVHKIDTRELGFIGCRPVSGNMFSAGF
ncbi:MAG TPA: hypothetical protein VN281_10500 [Verrucomicrobiae bacterium]|nr:hypothetical protein [Verrucomicrobiae bacterium]